MTCIGFSAPERKNVSVHGWRLTVDDLPTKEILSFSVSILFLLTEN